MYKRVKVISDSLLPKNQFKEIASISIKLKTNILNVFLNQFEILNQKNKIK